MRGPLTGTLLQMPPVKICLTYLHLCLLSSQLVPFFKGNKAVLLVIPWRLPSRQSVPQEACIFLTSDLSFDHILTHVALTEDATRDAG